MFAFKTQNYTFLIDPKCFEALQYKELEPKFFELIQDKESPKNLNALKELIRQGLLKNKDLYNFGSPSMKAAKLGKYEYLKVLIEGGDDVKFTTTFCETALTKALEHGHINCAELLLDAGAPIMVEGSFAKSVMEYAKQGKCGKEFMELFLAKKIKIEPVSDQNSKNNLLRVFNNLINSEESPENIFALRMLIAQGLLKNKDLYNFGSPSMEVAELGKYEYLKVLIEGGDDVKFTTTFCETALTKALEHGHIKCAELLLDSGAPIMVEGSFAKPVMKYAKKGKCGKEFMELFLAKKIKIEPVSQENTKDNLYSAFNNLIRSNESPENIFELRMFIAQGLLKIKATYKSESPSMKVAELGKYEYLKVLIEGGDDVKFTTTFCETALTKALEHGHIKCAELLLDSGAPIMVEGSFAKPVMEYAKRGKCTKEFIGLLYIRNIDLGSYCLNDIGFEAFCDFISQYNNLRELRLYNDLSKLEDAHFQKIRDAISENKNLLIVTDLDKIMLKNNGNKQLSKRIKEINNILKKHGLLRLPGAQQRKDKTPPPLVFLAAKFIGDKEFTLDKLPEELRESINDYRVTLPKVFPEQADTREKKLIKQPVLNENKNPEAGEKKLVKKLDLNSNKKSLPIIKNKVTALQTQNDLSIIKNKFFKLIENGETPENLNALKKLITQGLLKIKEVYTFGSPSMKAAELGKYQYLKILIEGGDNIKFTNKSCETALTKALKHGHIKCVELLLDAGAPIAMGVTMPIMKYAKQGKCIKEFMELLYVMKINIKEYCANDMGFEAFCDFISQYNNLRELRLYNDLSKLKNAHFQKIRDAISKNENLLIVTGLDKMMLKNNEDKQLSKRIKEINDILKEHGLLRLPGAQQRKDKTPPPLVFLAAKFLGDQNLKLNRLPEILQKSINDYQVTLPRIY